ncbi:HEXXH motif domain-containing protein [Actinoplanes sp. M2I2]|uniref:HEXXH motif domain-containing protein n=1 Tax=Actinoplanes sp. M2I2 TaxID=1734444 RepID=UPI002021830A|nr:HEXXH motif domain-containing protein [Actinoplanes sp. M2I2]
MDVPVENNADVLVRDLGTGFGSPAGLARLAAGQRQKRKVQLRMLLDDAAGIERSGLAEAARHVTDEVLDHPNLGVWLTHCLRRLARPDDGDVPLWADLGYLGWLRAARFITSRQAGSVEVVVRDGAVMLPGLGLARLAAPGTHGSATLSGRFEFTMGDTRLLVRDPGGEADERWLPLRKLGTTYSTLRTIHLDDLDPFRDLSDPYTGAQPTAPPPRLTAAQAAAWSRAFLGALEILRRQYEGYSAGIDEVLRTVVPLTAEPLTAEPMADGVSTTSPHAYGAVTMSAAGGPHQFALTLIRQCQHAKLSALTDQVELQKPSTVSDLYAPWRDDPRPLSGLLQGIYAHLGVADFWRTSRREAGARSLTADVEFARRRAQVRQALLVAAASPLLTDAGTAFVTAMGRAIRHWSSEDVPGHLESLARESSAGHLVAWRVRNMTVDVTGLHERRLAGLPPGPLPESVVVPAADVPAPTRLPVGHLKLNRAAGVEPGPDTPASDVAYADGDYERALALYTASPDSPESWAGVALCLRHLADEETVAALFRRPELVAALHRAAPGDITGLTTWLAT